MSCMCGMFVFLCLYFFIVTFEGSIIFVFHRFNKECSVLGGQEKREILEIPSPRLNNLYLHLLFYILDKRIKEKIKL